MGYTLVRNKNLIPMKECKEDIIQFKDIIILKSFNGKFDKDKVFIKDEELIICLDGVIYNSKELYSSFKVNTMYELVKKMYNQQGINFVKNIKGNFSGIIYDIKEDLIYSFTNHLGNKFVYYYNTSSMTIVSTDMFKLAEVMKSYNCKPKLDMEASYMMLTFGYMIYNKTLLQDVYKVLPGTYMMFKDEQAKEYAYYVYDNTHIIPRTEEKAMKEMYDVFSHTIKLSFEKDLENGYKHLCFLSGGLDSRMVALSGKKLGFNDITTLTFSQNYSNDEKISREISRDFHFDSIIKGLNNGNYLMDVNRYVKKNSGQIVYVGSAHSVDAVSKLNLQNYGMIHNGLLADVMQGGYLNAPYHMPAKMDTWAYSKKLINRLDYLNKFVEENYLNEEHFCIFNRGINAIYNGSISIHDVIETGDDFTYPDIVDFSNTLDPKYKYKEVLFVKMINKYYPEAIKYKWQTWNARPTNFNFKYMNGYVGRAYRRLCKMYYMAIYKENKANMNPYDKWYAENHELNTYINSEFKTKIDLIEDASLKKDCIYLFESGLFTEKAQVLTLLEFVKIINEI